MPSKITIFGAGLSGMITALYYAKQNINTLIVEKKSVSSPSFFKDIRTTAITNSSKLILEKIGIWDEFKEFISPINDIYVVDNKAPAMLHFASKILDNDGVMGYIIENHQFKKKLLDLIKSNSDMIEIIDNSIYSSIVNIVGECSFKLNNKPERYKCDLIIICEGKNSEARKLFFSSMYEKNYHQHALTFITHHEKPHENTAIEHFLPSGPFAILPLKSPYHSSIVWTLNDTDHEVINKISQDELTYLVQQNFGEFLGKIEIIGEKASFPLKAYITRQYYNKNIALIADSAHIIHPLAGQGLNQGIKDIETLVQLTSKYGAGKTVLEKYQNLRIQDNLNMLELTDNINSIFTNNSKLFHTTRQIGFKLIEKIPFLKNALIKYAMGKR